MLTKVWDFLRNQMTQPLKNTIFSTNNIREKRTRGATGDTHMSEENHNIERNHESGSIGIGAMIVFIALILVAAVASTIIIKTAEELQQNAEQNSSDTRQQISGKIALIDVVVRATGDELDNVDANDDGAPHITIMDVIFRISSGSSGIYPPDLSYYITCEVSSSLGMAVDAGLFDALDLNTEGDVADATELEAGISYLATITLGSTDTTDDDTLDTDDTDPGCAARATQGETLNMRIVVDGGGETLTELKIDSLTLGTSIM